MFSCSRAENWMVTINSAGDTAATAEGFLNKVRTVGLVPEGVYHLSLGSVQNALTIAQKDSTPPRQPPVPNPKNMSNIAKIQDLEQQIAR